MLTKTLKHTIAAWTEGENFVIYTGDCHELLKVLPDACVTLTLTSPPYFMGKSYDKSTKLSDFQAEISKLAPSLVRLSKDNGSICWQVGYHAKNGEVYPLDYAIFEAFRTSRDLVLRNRIAWTFGHGEHCRDRFSGRHETILWYTKKGDYIFDLDAVRVPQKYPGKRHYKGPRRGEFSGNPFGKNPSDVWDIPNVKAGHVEKTSHPCQFPVALAQRLVNALSGSGDTVLDPYAGSGTTGIAALLAGRRFLGAEVNPKYAKIAEARYQALARGTLRYLSSIYGHKRPKSGCLRLEAVQLQLALLKFYARNLKRTI